MTAGAPHAADYLTEPAGIISSRRTECAEQIGAAAQAIGACVAAGGIIHLSGSGHSRLVAIDAAVRAATMTNSEAICPDEWVGRVERLMEVVDVFLDTGVPAGDALFHPPDTAVAARYLDRLPELRWM